MIYYTNAHKAFAEQDRPDLSLGGYISSTPVLNDELANIFSNASQLTLERKDRETRMIAYHNSTVNPVTASVWVEQEADPNYDILIALVDAETDDCDDPFFEQIKRSTAKPFEATFVEATEASPAQKSVPANGYIGIWMMRVLKDQGTEIDPFDMSEGECSSVNVEEAFQLKIDTE